MRFDGFAPPKHDTRLTKKAAVKDARFMSVMMALWDLGHDTKMIATTMFEHEHVVAYALAIGRERRRGQVPCVQVQCFSSVEAVSLAMRA